MLSKITTQFQHFDWHFLSSSALLSAGTILARILGVAFSFVLAAVFLPADLGRVQYGITLGLLVALLTQPFGQHIFARFIGRYKDDPAYLQPVLATMWLLLVGLSALTSLIALPVLLLIDADVIGVLAVFGGVTLFYAYWGWSSGFQASYKLTVAYVASNAIQLLLVGVLIYGLRIESPILALVIYGISYLMPLALLQLFVPLPLAFHPALMRQDVLREILVFALPVWLLHASYVVYDSIAILLLEFYSGSAAVGIFAIARTLSFVFAFIPTSITTLLMPRVAGLSHDPRTVLQLLKSMLAVALIFNTVVFLVYVFTVEHVVRLAFGDAYLGQQSGPYIWMALTTIVLGIQGIISAVVVGKGRPVLAALSYTVALVVTAASGLWLIPTYEATGATLAMFVGAMSALTTYGGIIVIRFYRSRNAENA